MEMSEGGSNPQQTANQLEQTAQRTKGMPRLRGGQKKSQSDPGDATTRQGHGRSNKPGVLVLANIKTAIPQGL